MWRRGEREREREREPERSGESDKRMRRAEGSLGMAQTRIPEGGDLIIYNKIRFN